MREAGNMDFIFNVKGLTAEDRAQWEKDNIELLKGTGYNSWSEKDKDRAFRDASFTNKYKGREDFEQLKALPPDKKDSLFLADMQPEETSSDAFVRQDDYIQTNVQNRSQWHRESIQMSKDFDEIASQVSPYYERYLNSDYLPWKEEDKVKAYARYQTIAEIEGVEAANKDLSNTIQNTVSENQPLWDKYLRGINQAALGAATAVSQMAGTVGGLLAAPLILATDEQYQEETKDLNLWEAYWHTVINNPVNRRFARVYEVGNPFDYAAIESQNPKDRWNRNEIINTAAQDDNLWDYITSENLVPGLIKDSGFTIGSIMSGQLLGQAARGMALARMNAVTRGINPTSAMAQSLNQVQNIAKWERRFNAYAAPSLIGGAEGALNAITTYDNIVDEYTQKADEFITTKVQEEKERLLNNPNLIREEGYTANTEEELEAQIALNLSDVREDIIRKGKEEAAKGEMIDFTINSFINGAANTFLKSPMLGGRIEEALKRSKVGKLFSSDAPKFTYGEGKFSAYVPPITKRVTDAAKETFGEGLEEYLQDLSSAFSEGYSQNSMEEFMARRYNGEAYEAIESSLVDNITAGLSSLWKAAGSKEAIRAGVLGALSQATGTATINRQAFREMQESKTLGGKGLNLLRTIYRNPFIESIKGVNTETDYNKRTAEVMNKWLNTGNNKEIFSSLATASAYTREMNEHNETGDEYSYQNSKQGKLINDALMILEMQDTPMYEAFINQFTDILSAEQGSEQEKVILENSKYKTLDEAKKHAQTILDNIQRVQEVSKEVEDNIGKFADLEVKKALIFGKLNFEKFDQRQQELEGSFNKTGMTQHTEEEASKLSKGNIERFKKDKLQEERTKLQTKVSSLEKNEKLLTKKQKKEIKQLKSEIQKIDKILKDTTKEISDEVLSKTEIMHLSPMERFRMLNPKNRKFYSDAQLEIIDSLVKEQEMQDMKFMSKIEDTARLEQAKREYLNNYTNAIKDPSSLNKWASILKANLAYDLAKSKAATLNNITDKEQFINSFFKELDQAKTPIEKNMLMAAIKDNPFYKDIVELAEDQKDFITLLESNEKFKNLSTVEKNQIGAVLDFLHSKHLNPKKIESLQALTSNNAEEFIKFLLNNDKRNTLNFTGNIKEVESIIGTYQSIMDSLIEEDSQRVSIESPVKSNESKNEDNPAVVPEVKEVKEETTEESEEVQEKEEQKKEQKEEKKSVKKDTIISDKIKTVINLILHKEIRGRKGYESIDKFYERYGINDYLATQTIGTNINLVLIYDPSLTNAVKADMGDSFTSLNTPIIVAIKDDNGSYDVNGVKYQPIGIYPESEDSGKLHLLSNINEEEQAIIKNSEGEPIIAHTNGYISTNAPEHTKGINTSINELALREEPDAVRDLANESQENKDKLDIALRDKILPKIHVRIDEKTGRKILEYIDTDNRGGTTPLEVFVFYPEDTENKEGKSFKEVLKNGTAEEILSFNSRLKGDFEQVFRSNYGLGNALHDFFGEEHPFKRIAEGKKSLSEIEKDLNNIVTNYIKFSEGYQLILEENGKTEAGLSKYSLSLKGGDYISKDDKGNVITVKPKFYLGEVYDGHLSANDIVNIFKNLFLDESGNFRKTQINNKQLPIVMWQVNYEDFAGGVNENKEAAKKHREEVWDDGILYLSKAGLKRTVKEVQIHNPLTTVTPIKPSPVKSNQDNADLDNNGPVITPDQVGAEGGTVDKEIGLPVTGTPGKKPDNTRNSILNLVRRIIEGSKKIKRSTDNKSYEDSNSPYTRVTSLIQDTPHEQNEYDVPSKSIGNSVDKFIRDLFNNTVDSNYNYPNAKREYWEELQKSLQPYIDNLKSQGFEFISKIDYGEEEFDGVRVRGSVRVKNSEGKIEDKKVGGTLDILAYNPITGKFRIIDIKTVHDEASIHSEEYHKKWGRQLLMYKRMLQNEYGIDIEQTSILPIKVFYNTLNFTEENGQLKVGNVNWNLANPTFLEEVILDADSYDFTIPYEELSQKEKETVKEIIEEGTPEGLEFPKDENKSQSTNTLNKPKIKGGAKSYLFGNRGKKKAGSIPNTKYPFSQLNDILTEEQLKSLKERIEKGGMEFNQENWESLSSDLQEKNINCVKE